MTTSKHSSAAFVPVVAILGWYIHSNTTTIHFLHIFQVAMTKKGKGKSNRSSSTTATNKSSHVVIAADTTDNSTCKEDKSFDKAGKLLGVDRARNEE